MEEKPVYEIVEESDIKKVAKILAKASLNEQQLAIDNIFAQSAVNAIKVAIETIEILKKSNDDLMKSNKQFMALCDKAIETLQKSIQDGEVTETEKRDVRDKIMDILKMASNSHSNASVAVKEGRDKAIVAGAVVSGSLGASAILGIIATTIVKVVKK